MPTDLKSLAKTYFDSWKAKDFETFRSILAEEVVFRGPLGSANNAEECVKGIQKMAEILTDIRVHKIWVDGKDIVTWFDIYTQDAGPVAVANWSHTESGKISKILVTFDPRTITGEKKSS